MDFDDAIESMRNIGVRILLLGLERPAIDDLRLALIQSQPLGIGASMPK
jgi:hypothetical protein